MPGTKKKKKKNPKPLKSDHGTTLNASIRKKKEEGIKNEKLVRTNKIVFQHVNQSNYSGKGGGGAS